MFDPYNLKMQITELYFDFKTRATLYTLPALNLFRNPNPNICISFFIFCSYPSQLQFAKKCFSCHFNAD